MSGKNNNSTTFQYEDHIESSESLVTSYEATRAGFVALALEKNRKATPVVSEARALKVSASKAKNAQELLTFRHIRASLLTAAGVSDKATKHLTEVDQNEAIKGLVENFLEPAGKHFVEELVYRFLLIRGDSLGGSMRNLAGSFGERKFSRAMLSVLTNAGKKYSWLDSRSKKWVNGAKDEDADVEIHVKGLSWESNGKIRTLRYNLTVPMVKKNVDLCLFDCKPNELGNIRNSAHRDANKYIALGELKGGIDPAGADEHWKTANSALDRIRKSFSAKDLSPLTFFLGAAIEKSMADEIYKQLEAKTLTNAANLTEEKQLFSACNWLIQL